MSGGDYGRRIPPTPFADLANTESGGYIEFDEGLRMMTRHARSLGYDAVILFLDELLL